MGRVIKGSAESAERYTLAVPAFGIPAPGRGNEAGPAPDAEPFAPVSEPEPPSDPPIDLDAVRVQAQAIVDAAESEAKSILDAAQTRADAVVEDAAKRALSVADEARRQAHDDGYAGGVSEANATMGGMLDAMRELIEAARSERHGLFTSAEPELVKMAVGIAERVLHQQIALDHGVVVEMARAAISRLVDRESITVRVNPADIDRMREHRDELLALGDVKTMRVIEDQRVDRGGVVLETDAGSIDAKISTQMTEVRKILHIVDDIVVQPAPAQPDQAAETPPGETPLSASRAS